MLNDVVTRFSTDWHSNVFTKITKGSLGSTLNLINILGEKEYYIRTKSKF